MATSGQSSSSDELAYETVKQGFFQEQVASNQSDQFKMTNIKALAGFAKPATKLKSILKQANPNRRAPAPLPGAYWSASSSDSTATKDPSEADIVEAPDNETGLHFRPEMGKRAKVVGSPEASLLTNQAYLSEGVVARRRSFVRFSDINSVMELEWP